MEAVLVAAVAGFFTFAGVAITEIRKMRTENSAQHTVNKATVESGHSTLLAAIEKVDSKVDAHITWHAHTDTRPDAQIIVLPLDKETRP